MQIKINLQIFVFAMVFILTGQIEIYAIIMFFALIHELFHMLSGILLGLKPKSLEIMPFGLSVVFEIYESKKDLNLKINMVSTSRIELLTYSLGGCRSILLSYVGKKRLLT